MCARETWRPSWSDQSDCRQTPPRQNTLNLNYLDTRTDDMFDIKPIQHSRRSLYVERLKKIQLKQNGTCNIRITQSIPVNLSRCGRSLEGPDQSPALYTHCAHNCTSGPFNIILHFERVCNSTVILVLCLETTLWAQSLFRYMLFCWQDYRLFHTVICQCKNW